MEFRSDGIRDILEPDRKNNPEKVLRWGKIIVSVIVKNELLQTWNIRKTTLKRFYGGEYAPKINGFSLKMDP
ncbi:MAG: hypothetical protein OEM28_08515 [Nitrosopumilus sp.]|nr:hypothetical protein [Nitrosopumilus sp.]MDH3487893.1 hypothetical protein [Nitrosopumilus sp.]